MKLVSTQWTPLPADFDPYNFTLTSTHLIIGGERNQCYQAKLTQDPLVFEPLTLPEHVFAQMGFEGDDDPAESMGIGGLKVDWSTTPAQLTMHLTEYQGGSFGLWVCCDASRPREGERIENPRGDADLPFGDCYILHRDLLVAESSNELYQCHRQHGAWQTEVLQVPFDRSAHIMDMALSPDAQTLAVVTSSDQVGTALFTWNGSHFVHQRNFPNLKDMITWHDNHLITYDYISPRYNKKTSIKVWDQPMWESGASPRELKLPDPCNAYFSNNQFVGVCTYTTCHLMRCDTGEHLLTLQLAGEDYYSTQQGMFLKDRLVILSQNQIGVFQFAHDLS